MKLILDVDSPVERGCLPIFAPLLPMKHAFCLARSTFSLFSLPLPSPSFILTIGQRNVSLSFLFACFYLVADPVGESFPTDAAGFAVQWEAYAALPSRASIFLCEYLLPSSDLRGTASCLDRSVCPSHEPPA